MKFPRAELKKIAEKYYLKLLILFGSHAQGKSNSQSDLDLAFYAEKKIDEEDLYRELVKLFKTENLDLVNLFSTHNHLLRYEILSKGKVLYEAKKGLGNKMQWQSYFDFVDFQKYYLMRSSLLDKKLEEMTA